MPGYGISEAATTLAGQSLGANRIRLLKRFANISVWSGMLVMGIMGAVMYVVAPQIIGVMTPDDEIRLMGTEILRIEAFAEPMFARLYRYLWRVRWRRRHVRPQPDELRKHLGSGGLL